LMIGADGPIRASAISASPSGESAPVRFSQDEQFRAGYLAPCSIGCEGRFRPNKIRGF
jgi:hypothetical protein